MDDGDLPAVHFAQGRGRLQAWKRHWRAAKIDTVLNHRIRTAWANNASQLLGCEVEVDETHLGGKDKKTHQGRKLNAGRGTVGKTAVVGTKKTRQQTDQVIESDRYQGHHAAPDCLRQGFARFNRLYG